MITLTATIDILPTNGVLSSATSNIAAEKDSSSLQSLINIQNPQKAFVGVQKSNDENNFETPYEIKIAGTGIKQLSIVFDKDNNAFPKSLKLYTQTEKQSGHFEVFTGTGSVESWVLEEKLPSAQAELYSCVFYYSEASNTLSIERFCELLYTYLRIKSGSDESLGSASVTLSPKYNVTLDESVLSYIYVDDSHEITIEVLGEYTVGLSFYVSNEAKDEIEYFLEYLKEITIKDQEYISETIITRTLLGEYSEDDVKYNILNLSKYNNYVFVIDNWSEPNAPFKIYGIYDRETIVVDQKNILGLSSEIFDRADFKLPNFGVYSNKGTIEFNDSNEQVLDFAQLLLLRSGLKCTISLNDTLSEKSQSVGEFFTDEWNYDNDNKRVSVTLKDDLEEWQDIYVEDISYDPRNIESKPFSWLYDYLWGLTSNRAVGKGNYNMLALKELDETTQKILNNTHIQYPLLKKDTLWNEWRKLCEVCQLHIYKNNEGIIVCRYNGGN